MSARGGGRPHERLRDFARAGRPAVWAGARFDRAMVEKYLDLYAIADTADAPEDVREGVRELFRRAHAAGLHAKLVQVEYAP